MARIRNYQIERRWSVQKSIKPFESTVFSADFTRLLSGRGISSEAQANALINPKYSDLSNPLDLPDMQQAVDAILLAIKNKVKIAIYGDYDVDGVTATAILADFFKKIDIDVVCYIPSRVDEGYGLNTEAVTALAGQGVGLIITVDCGSKSVDVVEAANKLGVTTVVTDHHVLEMVDGKPCLPAAAAVVNPKRMTPDSPPYELAGAGVAFYLVRALMTHFVDKFATGQEKWLLDLVALGTICDIVPLVGENRILAKYGLSVLAKSRRAGIQALAQVSEVHLELVDSYKVGFLLGPRLNAAGRIEHAQVALSLLLTEDKVEAEALASQLNELNLERQEITEKVVAEAKVMIEKTDKTQKIYLLSCEGWPAGVVGIVASRLAEEYARPMLVAEDLGTELKGSARSIKSFNIIEALTECEDLLTRFGGHAFAAGFSLLKDNRKPLEKRLISIAEREISDSDLSPEISIDLDILNKNIDQKFIEELSLLEPYGMGNKKPVFQISKARISEARLVGSPAVHLKFSIEQEGASLSGIAFGYGEKLDLKVDEYIDLVVTLELNEWNNHKSPEFRLVDIRKSE